MSEEKNDKTYEERLDEIAELEEKHAVLGVSFSTQKDPDIMPDEAAGYVTKTMETGVKFLRERGITPKAHGQKPPQKGTESRRSQP